MLPFFPRSWHSGLSTFGLRARILDQLAASASGFLTPRQPRLVIGFFLQRGPWNGKVSITVSGRDRIDLQLRAFDVANRHATAEGGF